MHFIVWLPTTYCQAADYFYQDFTHAMLNLPNRTSLNYSRCALLI